MSAPFLPEPETATAPPKKSAKRILLLWVMLIVMFLAIWQFLTPAERTAPGVHEAVAPVAETSLFWSSTWMAFAPFGFVALVLFLFLRAYRQNLRFNIAQEPGRMALAHRRFHEAVELFRKTVPQFAKQPAYRASAVLNIAESQLKAGSLEDALASCAEIERSRTLVFNSNIRARIATLTAFVFALKGDLPAAERWAADARNRIAKNHEYRIGHAGELCLAEATIACRRGDHAEAVKLLDTRWLELRYAITADAMRIVEVVRAFAEAQGGVRASNAAGERLVRIEPVVKGELAFLGVGWPEMQTFLGAHGLGGPPG